MKRRMLAAAMAVTMTALTACSGGGAASQTGETQTTGAQAAADSGESQGNEAEGAENNDSGEKVTLSLYWWGNQTRNDVTKQAVDLYMSQNPNVEIKVEFADWSGYWDKMAAMAAGGNLPDIIQQDYSYINQYQKSGQLANLSEFIDSGIIDVSNIPESVIESGSIDGNCYALSLGSNAPMMIYDKAAAEAAGLDLSSQMTLDELYDACQKVYDATGAKSIFDGGLTMLQMISRANGSHLFDELNQSEDTASMIHFENVEKFAQADFHISPDLLAETTNAIETRPIVNGGTWNEFSFSNLFISFSDLAGKELGMTMYPIIDGAKNQPMFLKPSMFFSIAETSQHKEEAAKFINWFTNSVECNEILMAERGVPINTEVAEVIKPQMDEAYQIVFDYVAEVSEIATPIDDPDPNGKGEVEALCNTLVEDIRYGDTAAAEAAEQFVTESNRILAEAAK